MKPDTLGIFFWMLFSIFVLVESCRLNLGSWRMPGPGYFPFGAALLLGIVTLMELVKALRKPIIGPIDSGSEPLRWQNVIFVMIALVGYALLLNRLGFVLCTFAFVVFLRWTMTSRRWWNTLAVALSASLGLHVVFNLLLNAQLPKGIFIF